MSEWKRVAGTGNGAGVKADSLIPPLDTSGITITRVEAIDAAPDASGRPQKRITVSYNAPSDGGTLIGFWVYLDAPDTAGALRVADGSTPADGKTGEGGRFSPQDLGFVAHNPASQQFSFLSLAPTQAEYWRVYIVPGSALRHDAVVQAGLAGASISHVFIVLPPATSISAREYAPLVRNPHLTDPADLGWTANPLQVQLSSGDQDWVVCVEWDWPTDDQNYQTLGGVNIVVDDGVTQTYMGNVPKTSPGKWQAQPMSLKPGITNYKIWLISYSISGVNNTLLTGITPAVTFTMTRQLGSTGSEYAALVTSDGVHSFVTVNPLVNADGTAVLRVNAYWTAPSDPQFGGINLCVKKPADSTIYSLGSASTTPLEITIPEPATVQTWRFYLVSVDVNHNRNHILDNGDGTYDAGETPWIDISVGNATGQLNLAKANSSSYDTDITVSGTKLTLGVVSAAKITTGYLRVGGSGMVSIVQIYDTFSSLIGWIGDDTGSSGYVGGWFKRLRIGGGSPASAQVVADSSGNVTISTSLLVGTIPTSSLSGLIVNGQIDTGIAVAKLDSGTLPSGVVYAGTILASQILAGTITVGSGGITILGGGGLTIDTGLGVVSTFNGSGVTFFAGGVYTTIDSLGIATPSVSASEVSGGNVYASSTFRMGNTFLSSIVINFSQTFVGSGGVDTTGNIKQNGYTAIDTSGNVIARGGFYVNNGTTYTGQTCTVVGSFTIGGSPISNLIFQGGILVSYS